MEPENDGALIQKVREGDDEAFAVFVERYKDALVNYLTHLTRCRSRAEDVAQEAFVRFYRNVDRCRQEPRLAPYLFRIATNVLASHRRRERRWLELVPLVSAFQWRTSIPADEPLFSNEIQRKVAAALEQLPVRYRAPLVLFEIEEWPQEEIAAALGCRTGTVKSRISRGKALMRKQLEAWWIGDRHGRDRKPHEAVAANDGIATIHG